MFERLDPENPQPSEAYRRMMVPAVDQSI